MLHNNFKKSDYLLVSSEILGDEGNEGVYVSIPLRKRYPFYAWPFVGLWKLMKICVILIWKSLPIMWRVLCWFCEWFLWKLPFRGLLSAILIVNALAVPCSHSITGRQFVEGFVEALLSAAFWYVAGGLFFLARG